MRHATARWGRRLLAARPASFLPAALVPTVLLWATTGAAEPLPAPPPPPPVVTAPPAPPSERPTAAPPAATRAPESVSLPKAPTPAAAPAKAPTPKSAATTKPEAAPAAPSDQDPTAGKDEIKAPDDKDAPKKKHDFVKGELASVGSVGLVPWENRVGAVLGVEGLGNAYYASVTPSINYSTTLMDQDFSMTFGVPLRWQLVDTRPPAADGSDEHGWSHVGRFRTQDWDEVGDYAQFIRSIQFGGKESHVYVDINAFKASSLGHGTIMRRYNPNLDFNRRQVSGEIDGFMDYAGAEAFVNNVVAPNVIGGLAFIKPLSFINRKNYVMRSFSLGVTAVADLDAPLRAKLDLADVNNDGVRSRQYLVDQDTYKAQYLSTQVVATGLDAEIKLVDTKTTDWKTYVDYSMLMSGIPTDGNRPVDGMPPTRYVNSGGLTWGNLVRINLGEDRVHALRLRAELRRYDQNYQPSYFDVMYEVQRLQYLIGSRTANPNGTKLQTVLGRPILNDGAKVLGMYMEASWRIDEIFAMAVGLEVNDSEPDNNLFVHVEIPEWKNLQLLATFHRRSASSAGDLFGFNSTGREVFLAKARYRVVEWFHINAEAVTPFGIGPDSFFANSLDFNVRFEFGFNYRSKKK